eukprot:bmy_18931T0
MDYHNPLLIQSDYLLKKHYDHQSHQFLSNYYTRIPMTNFPILTPSQNVIYLYSSRNHRSPI